MCVCVCVCMCVCIHVIPTNSSGPMLALCLAREDAINHWRNALGPKIIEEAVQNEPES